MVASSCLLINIGRRQKEWHPDIFEVEEGFHLIVS